MRIAIVGMACLFPGAPNLDAFLRHLKEGVDAIGDVPAGRIDPVFFDKDASGGDRFYCRRGGFVDAFAAFDATGFGVMPVAVRGAEPDQLLALQVAAAALSDAGYDDRPLPGERAAVILGRGGYSGAGHTRLEQHVRSAEQLVATLRALVPGIDEPTLLRVKREFQAGLGAAGPDAAIGLVPNLAASRIAQRLDLHGPAYTVDAACASSLVAVTDACRELESGRVDVALCGGVHLCQDEAFWSVFCQLGALSRSERIRPFDRRADGLLIGEGVGIVVLKRLEDAERDGDRVYAVLRGAGIASDGRGATLMSPAVDGQVRSLERAWREAELDPRSVGLVEAHGTGTPAGDTAELTTLARVFGAADGDRRAVLGSVKSMIGHTMPAAGAAGLIKAALAVHHGLLLPTLHCEEPHELLASTRFRVLDRAEPWEGQPRRAGVSAFGFGGINAHVVLEGHVASAPARARSTTSSTDRYVVYSAADPTALAEALTRRKPRSDGGPARVVVFDPTDARIDKARTVVARGAPWRGRDGIWFSPRGLLAEGGTIAFVFPGVDSSFEPRVDDVARHFDLPVPALATAKDLETVGMGIIHVNRLLDRVLRSLGVVPKDIAGHSIGEWSGMLAAGILSEPTIDAFMARIRPGSLEVPGVLFVAAGCGVDRAREAIAGLDGIALSHDNCPHQVIVCGREASIEVALSRFRTMGVLAQKLPFQSGFHSPLFADYLGPHVENFRSLLLEAPKTPLWSATTCAPYPSDVTAIRKVAVDHLVEPVRFREVVESLYAKGTRVFVQVGTGSLVNFVEDTLRGRPHLAIAANVKERSGMEQLRRVMAAVYVEGADVDLSRVASKAAATMTLSLGVPLVHDFAPIRSAAAEASARGASLDATSLALGAAAPAGLAAPGNPVVPGGLADEFAQLMKDVVEAQQSVIHRMAHPVSPRAARPAPREGTTTRTLSVTTMPELVDHSFFRQPEGWENLSDRYPVVPMTTSIDLMIEHAESFVPGRVAVAVEDFRAYRWFVVSKPVDVKITCSYDGEDAVHVRIGDYSEAKVRLADAYPEAPPADVAPLEAPVPAVHDARALYDDRWMFHGKAFQGVVDLGTVGRDGIRGKLVTPAARGALLDNAGQLFGYWVMVNAEKNRMAMPVRITKLRLFGRHPRTNDVLDCTVRVRSMDDKSVVADLSLSKDGRTWVTIEGWEDRRFETDARLWNVMLFPENHLLAEEQPEGFVLFSDVYGAATTRDQLHRRFMGEEERADYERQGPRKQRAFLSGRIAAKDALRGLLWKLGHGPTFPVEVRIDSAPSGEPVVRSSTGRDLHVSIAHKNNVAVALAREGRRVGIDIESIEPRTDAFVELSFSPPELELVKGEPRDEALTRLWAVKEAAAKATGEGLSGNPRRFSIRDRSGDRWLVGDVWVRTKRYRDFIIAWTES